MDAEKIEERDPWTSWRQLNLSSSQTRSRIQAISRCGLSSSLRCYLILQSVLLVLLSLCMALPPLAPPIRGLWAPSVLYEAHNPRQRTRLDLYSSASTSNQSRKDVEAKYAAKRDVVNVLHASTSRMVWDYAAEAATLSDEEAAFEAEVGRTARIHAFPR